MHTCKWFLGTLIGPSNIYTRPPEPITNCRCCFMATPKRKQVAGRILYDVIEQRIDALMSLATEHLARPLSTDDIVAFVAKPLNPVR